MKKYLLCSLDDEHYASASFVIYDDHADAEKAAVNNCQNYIYDCEISVEKSGFRITGTSGNSFYVNEIKPIDADKGDHLLVWHHAYEGVDFEIRLQGSFEECLEKKNKEVAELMSQLNTEIVWDGTVDTGIEWETFDIVRIN